MTAHANTGDVAVFEAQRPRLAGLAYRMLGLRTDAEDAVQEAWLRWQRATTDSIDNPAAWLTTVTTRICVDRLRAQSRSRIDYVGPWLPEPLAADAFDVPAATAELADSLTYGFLVLLDRLSAAERAALLLADVFRAPFAEVATTLDRSEEACRQLVSRARRKLDAARNGPLSVGAAGDVGTTRPAASPVQDDAMASAARFAAALQAGDLPAAMAELAADVVLISDGGGMRRSAGVPVVGARRVATFFLKLVVNGHADGLVTEPGLVNGLPAMVLRRAGEVDTVIVVDGGSAGLQSIWVVRNPDKLARFDEPMELY